MFLNFLWFGVVVALDCNQFRMQRNFELSWKTRIKLVHTKQYTKEVCTLLTLVLVLGLVFDFISSCENTELITRPKTVVNQES